MESLRSWLDELGVTGQLMVHGRENPRLRGGEKWPAMTGLPPPAPPAESDFLTCQAQGRLVRSLGAGSSMTSKHVLSRTGKKIPR